MVEEQIEERSKQIKEAERVKMEKANQLQYESSKVDGLYRDFELDAMPIRDISIPNCNTENHQLTKDFHLEIED